MSASDAVLLQRWVKRADAEAFAELVARHSGLVYGTCRRVLANATEAEDLTQECFVKLSQQAPRDTGSLAGWLHKVALNGCLDRIRGEGRRREREAVFAEGQAEAVEPTWDEMQSFVDEAVAELPDDLRLAVLYHFFEGRTHLETARMLGLTRSGVTRRLQRGVEQIREALRKRGALVTVAALGSLFSAHAAEAAPASLTASLGRIAVAGHAGGAAAAVGMSLAVKVAAVAAIVVAVAGVAAWPRVREGAKEAPPQAVVARAAAPLAPKPAMTKVAEAAGAAAATANQEKRTVHGTVVSVEGYPRADVTLLPEKKAEDRDTPQSEVDGAFTLADVPAGATRWFAHSFNTGTAALFTLPADGASPRVVLDLKTMEVSGRVVDGAGRPVPKARVELRVTDASGETYSFEPTPVDRSGFYEVRPVPVGDGLVLEARVLPPGDEAAGAWSARKSLAKGMHGAQLPDLVVSAETAQNIAANQDEDKSPCRFDTAERAPIGGLIRDEAGRPIVGVAVEAMAEVNDGHYSWMADTDAAGRWSLAMPTNAANISLRVQHREYVGTALDRSVMTPPLARLRDRTSVMTLKRGLRVQGVVKGAQGKPVADALVLTHSLYSQTASGPRPTGGAPIEDEYSVRTAPDGTFAVSCLPAGPARLKVLHSDYVSAVVKFDMKPQMAPVEVALSEGGVVRGRVVDVAGLPMPEATLDSSEWINGDGEQNEILLHATADAKGEFEVKHVPTEGTVDFGVQAKRGSSSKRYMSMSVDLAAREEPYTLTLYEPPTFTGTVVDDATDKPITEFRVRTGRYSEWNGGVSWNEMAPVKEVQSDTGAFSITVERYIIDGLDPDRFAAGVDAPGYFSGVTPLKRPGEPMEPMVIRLRKGVPVTGNVFDAKGNAVAGAQVMIVTPGRCADVQNGALSQYSTNAPEHTVETEGDGAFALPPCEGPATLLALHDSGYACLDAAGLTPGGKVVLSPWAKVEGVVYANGAPESEAAVELRPAEEGVGDGVQWTYRDTSHTDGRFEFDKVPAMALMAERYLPNLIGATLGTPVTTVAGETAFVEVGLSGRRATGRIVCEAPLPADLKYVTVSAVSNDDAEARYGGTAERDGSFHIDGIPEGRYTLTVEVFSPGGLKTIRSRVYAGSLDFTMDAGASGEAEELGEVRLEQFVAPEAGSIAPELRGRTLDGQDFSLEDLRGQYVLLEFWNVDRSAAYKETAMRELWSRYGAGGKVAFVGVNFLDPPQHASRAAEKAATEWPQIVSNNPRFSVQILCDYGVSAFPSLWLIGPDGTVIGKGLSAEAAGAALRAAVGQ